MSSFRSRVAVLSAAAPSLARPLSLFNRTRLRRRFEGRSGRRAGRDAFDEGMAGAERLRRAK
jgi:hypothetical protein